MDMNITIMFGSGVTTSLIFKNRTAARTTGNIYYGEPLQN